MAAEKIIPSKSTQQAGAASVGADLVPDVSEVVPDTGAS